jgi:hypothetical protein
LSADIRFAGMVTNLNGDAVAECVKKALKQPLEIIQYIKKTKKVE